MNNRPTTNWSLKSYLYNKCWRRPKRKKRASKGLGDFFGIWKRVRGVYFFLKKFKGFDRCWRITAEGKFANKTLFQTVMSVRQFGFVVIVMVQAFFFRKLFRQMLHSMKRLREYCEQYYQSHQSIGIAYFFLHWRKSKAMPNKIRLILTNFRICKSFSCLKKKATNRRNTFR